MRVTLLGHASLLVELDGATCLMDPVLADPFEEGTVVSRPRRAIDVDALPARSALAGSTEHRRSFFPVRAYSRRSGTVYELGRDGQQVALQARTLPDLLMYYLVYVAEGSEVAALTEVDQQLSALRAAARRARRLHSSLR